jgi:hypothetical protein
MLNQSPYQLLLDLKKKLTNPALTDDQRLTECDNFIQSLQPITNSNAEEISNTYKISGDILFKNNRFQDALTQYTHQQNSIMTLIPFGISPVSVRLSLASAHLNIGKSMLKLNDLDGAKQNLISAWKDNDQTVTLRAEKNENISTYNGRLKIFFLLKSIASLQNDDTELVEICTSYAEKLKLPGVSKPQKEAPVVEFRNLLSCSLTSIEFKCILAINISCFLSTQHSKHNRTDEALTSLNFALEKITEFELFNSRPKYKQQSDETQHLIIEPKIVLAISARGSKLCLEKNDIKKFKEFVLKGLEYYEKSIDEQFKNDYLKFLLENIDRINSISPTNSEQDLQITSKIHSHICKSFSRDKDFDKTMQLFTSFNIADPSTDNLKLYKIFVDKQHHISQIHKINFGENSGYNDLVRSEYSHLIKFGNLILDNTDFSNKDKIEIINRIVDKAKTLGSDFNEDKLKFEKLSIQITNFVNKNNDLILKQVRKKAQIPANYVISGSSYVAKQTDDLIPPVKLSQIQELESGASRGQGSRRMTWIVPPVLDPRFRGFQAQAGAGAGWAQAGAVGAQVGAVGAQVGAGAGWAQVGAVGAQVGAVGAQVGAVGAQVGAGAGWAQVGAVGAQVGAGAGWAQAGAVGAQVGAGWAQAEAGRTNIVRPVAKLPDAQSQISFGGLVQHPIQIVGQPGAFKRTRVAVTSPSSQSFDFSALEILAELATAGQSAINSSSPSGQPSGGSASSVEPQSKRSRNA